MLLLRRRARQRDLECTSKCEGARVADVVEPAGMPVTRAVLLDELRVDGEGCRFFCLPFLPTQFRVLVIDPLLLL